MRVNRVKVKFVEIAKGVWRDPTVPCIHWRTGEKPEYKDYKALSNTRADDVKLPKRK